MCLCLCLYLFRSFMQRRLLKYQPSILVHFYFDTSWTSSIHRSSPTTSKLQHQRQCHSHNFTFQFLVCNSTSWVCLQCDTGVWAQSRDIFSWREMSHHHYRMIYSFVTRRLLSFLTRTGSSPCFTIVNVSFLLPVVYSQPLFPDLIPLYCLMVY